MQVWPPLPISNSHLVFHNYYCHSSVARHHDIDLDRRRLEPVPPTHCHHHHHSASCEPSPPRSRLPLASTLVQLVSGPRPSTNSPSSPSTPSTMTVSLLPGQSVSQYEVVNELGSGAFATVYTCIDKRNPHGPHLALKVISKRDLDADQLKLTKLEVDIHANLPSHPHLVGLKEWFEDASALYLVMDRCDYGDLYDLVAASSSPSSKKSPLSSSSSPSPTRRGLPDAITHRYLTQMTQALDTCHKHGVYHRDLKPENMLLAGPLDRQGYPMSAKLADFGLATRDPFSTELGLGTRSYLAPECLDESIDGYASAPADVFALALVALQLSHPGVRLWKATVADDREWAAWVRAVNEQQSHSASASSRRYQPPHMVRMMHRHAPTSSSAMSVDPVASVRSDISDMDFAAVMGHHEDDLVDDEDMYREYHESDEDEDHHDDEHDEHMHYRHPAATIPVPKLAPVQPTKPAAVAGGLPLAGIAPHLAPVPSAIPNYIPPHLAGFTKPHGSSSVKPSPIALAAAAGASAPRPAWTVGLTKMAPTTTTSSASAVAPGSSPAFGTPHSAMVDWSEYDDDDDDDDLAGTAASSLSLFMSSAMHGGAGHFPPTKAQAVPAPKAPSPITTPLAQAAVHDSAVALSLASTDGKTSPVLDADGKVRQESLDSAIGVSLTQGMSRLRV
ncbi:kinase-like domain-containing protein [Catenaria anguillulae PL171]|uniref:Kinase-like domain-containing protein n=1 Tax=Catenaria anguillulae PL171 TaxID=765915 RepID=A0A1Y2HZS8_9FUNG|nr:kinase-like domain-containing protein [Catenaria anguillulae PL171]